MNLASQMNSPEVGRGPILEEVGHFPVELQLIEVLFEVEADFPPDLILLALIFQGGKPVKITACSSREEEEDKS